MAFDVKMKNTQRTITHHKAIQKTTIKQNPDYVMNQFEIFMCVAHQGLEVLCKPDLIVPIKACCVSCSTSNIQLQATLLEYIVLCCHQEERTEVTPKLLR